MKATMDKAFLVEFESSRRPLRVSSTDLSVEGLLRSVLEVFQLADKDAEDYFLQYFDKSWEEYLDLVDIMTDSLDDKSKLKLIRKENTVTASQLSVLSSPASTSSLELDTSGTESFVSYKIWPTQYCIPTHKFPSSLRKSLEADRPLSWGQRKQLKDCLIDDMQQYIGLHATRSQRIEVCQALVKKYPYLKEPIGTGYDGFEQSMKDRFKNLRSEVCESDLTIGIKKRKALDGSPVSIKKPKKGEVNWQPNLQAGEDDISLKSHVDFMKREYIKAQKYRDMHSIETKMEITFPSRRQIINANCSVEELVDTYPMLFTLRQIQLEFKRLMTLDLDIVFRSNLERITAKIIALAKKTKGSKSKEIDSVLQCLAENLRSTSEARGTNTTEFHNTVAGLRLLPLILRDDERLYVQIFENTTSKEEMQKLALNGPATPYLGVIGNPHDAETHYYVIAERLPLFEDIEDFATGIMTLFAVYYVANISYPNNAKATYCFLQKKIMDIDGNTKTYPQKLITLLRSLQLLAK